MFIDKELEQSLLGVVTSKVKELGLDKVKSERLGVFCVSPDYSSIVGLRVLHALSNNGELPNYVFLDVAYPDDPQEKKDQYRKLVNIMAPYYKKTLDKIVLVEAAVLTGKNYTWIREELMAVGFLPDDIITVALLEMKDSGFKSDVVGEYISTMPEFYWEEPNKHWA